MLFYTVHTLCTVHVHYRQLINIILQKLAIKFMTLLYPGRTDPKLTRPDVHNPPDDWDSRN